MSSLRTVFVISWGNNWSGSVDKRRGWGKWEKNLKHVPRKYLDDIV
jgi:hypothetical protein